MTDMQYGPRRPGCYGAYENAVQSRAALTEEAVAGLAQAKAAHDRLERLYNPYVDFDGVMDTADRTADQILSLERI